MHMDDIDDDFLREHVKIISVEVPVPRALTPCPVCDQASVTDENGCCVHCGADRHPPAPAESGRCVVCETTVWRNGSFGDVGEPYGALEESVLLTEAEKRRGAHMTDTRPWIHDFCAQHSSACHGVGMACTNVRHDHGGMVEEAANSGGPVPDSDQLHCGHCGLPSHYDSGDEAYHHDDPKAPGCFLIAFAPSVIPHDPIAAETRAAQVITTYEAQIRANASDEWDTVKAVAECENGLYGSYGEVLDTARDLGYDTINDPSFEAALIRAFGLFQQRLTEEVASR